MGRLEVEFLHVTDMVRDELAAMRAAFPDLSEARCVGLLEANYRQRLAVLSTMASVTKYMCPHGFLELTACQECGT